MTEVKDESIPPITIIDNEVIIGTLAKPVLIFGADGRVRFGHRVKPDSAASKMLEILNARWPEAMERAIKKHDLSAAPAGVTSLENGDDVAGQPLDQPHVSLDEQPPAGEPETFPHATSDGDKTVGNDGTLTDAPGVAAVGMTDIPFVAPVRAQVPDADARKPFVTPEAPVEVAMDLAAGADTHVEIELPGDKEANENRGAEAAAELKELAAEAPGELAQALIDSGIPAENIQEYPGDKEATENRTERQRYPDFIDADADAAAIAAEIEDADARQAAEVPNEDLPPDSDLV